MKWISHKIITGSLVFSLTGDPLMSCFSVIGSILPDIIEGFPTDENYKKWRKNHRQQSHWFLPYLLLFFLSHAYAAYQNPGLIQITLKNFWILLHTQDNTRISILSMSFAFVMLGALLHIVEDAICGKVPGITLKERIGVKWFSVGSIQEYLLILPISCLLILLRLQMEGL